VDELQNSGGGNGLVLVVVAWKRGCELCGGDMFCARRHFRKARGMATKFNGSTLESLRATTHRSLRGRVLQRCTVNIRRPGSKASKFSTRNLVPRRVALIPSIVKVCPLGVERGGAFLSSQTRPLSQGFLFPRKSLLRVTLW
jgi:hypothetical protein